MMRFGLRSVIFIAFLVMTYCGVSRALAGEGKGWPADIPAELPKFEKCVVVNFSGNASQYILIVAASEKEHNAYLSFLESKGFAIYRSDTEVRAEKAGVRIDLNPHGPGQYQISAYFAKPGTWPVDKLPGFLKPLAGKAPIGEPYLDDGDYYFLYSFDYPITADEAKTYLKQLAASLNGGEYSDSGIADGFASFKGAFAWKGEKWTVSGEAFENVPGAIHFEFGWQKDE